MPRRRHCIAALLCLAAVGCRESPPPAAESRASPARSVVATAAPPSTTAPAAQPVAGTKPRLRSKPQPALRADAGRVFALLDPGETTTSAAHYAAMASVDGLAYRGAWSRIEPAAGSYDWSTLDDIVDVARAVHKPVALHIGADLPAWLPGLGAQTYAFTSPIGSGTAAVPWDATFLSRHGQLVAALAAHLKTRGDADVVSMVSIGAPVAEMSLVGCRNGTLGTSLAYDRAKYLDAWKTSVASHVDAFSDPVFAAVNFAISAPVPEICAPDGDGAAFYAELMPYALSLTPRASAFAADLNALGSSRLAQVDATTRRDAMLHFQTIWSYSDDPNHRFQGSLLDAVCSSWRAGARYLELYKADLDNPATTVQDAIAAARTGDGC